jgi:L-threonylcarbamoyladenylate synthase
MLNNNIISANASGIKIASNILRKNGIISFPTETVYGLGASALSSDAVAKIYAVKKRPSFNPLIVHVSSLKKAMEIGIFNQEAQKLAERFWPGPLTIVVPIRKNSQISELVTAGLSTVALRVPSNDIALALLKYCDIPLAAPSANLSGTVSSTNAKHVLDDFHSSIDIILDGGKCKYGIESTIIISAKDGFKLLRAGCITEDIIKKELNIIVQKYESSTIIAPGQLEKHYSPKAKLRLNASALLEDEEFIGFGKVPDGISSTINLSVNGNLIEAATNLFSILRLIDDLKLNNVAIAKIPNTGIGIAINDRLQRAAIQNI